MKKGQLLLLIEEENNRVNLMIPGQTVVYLDRYETGLKNENTITGFITRTNKALYCAKKDGHNCVSE